MKATTHYLNGDNHYKVYFMYEDYYGGERFRSFDEMQAEGDVPNSEGKCGTLVCYLHSYYWAVTERVEIMPLAKRPTVSEVKKFMESCFRFLDEDKAKQVKLSGDVLKEFRKDPYKMV